MTPLRFASDVAQDIRYAIRTLARTPTFTLAVVATIALAVGATSAIFTVVNAVVLRPLPFPESARALMLCETNASVGDHCGASPANVADWARTVRGARQRRRRAQRAVHRPRRDGDLPGSRRHRVSGVLPRASAAAGAWAGCSRTGTWRAAPIASRSSATRSGSSGSDRTRAVVGRPIVLDGEAFTVIGVLPQDAYIPLSASCRGRGLETADRERGQRGQPRLARLHGDRAARRRRHAGVARRRTPDGPSAARRGLSDGQQGLGPAHRRAAHGGGRRRQRHAVDVPRRRGLRPAHRLRERRQPAPRARERPRIRVRPARVARRRPPAARAAARDREPRPVAAGRRHRPAARRRGHQGLRRDRSGEHPSPGRGVDRRPRRGLHVRPVGGRRRDLRVGARAAGVAGGVERRAEGPPHGRGHGEPPAIDARRRRTRARADAAHRRGPGDAELRPAARVGSGLRSDGARHHLDAAAAQRRAGDARRSR